MFDVLSGTILNAVAVAIGATVGLVAATRVSAFDPVLDAVVAALP